MKKNRKYRLRNLKSPSSVLGGGARGGGPQRRGVLLLVVLGMLTLFLLIGTAFIVSSNQYRRAEGSLSKHKAQENLRASQEGFLGEVINQLIRDTNNQNSALRFHSLLRDLYGTEGFRGEVLVPVNTNQCVALAAKYAGARDFDGNSQIDMQPIGTNGPPEVFGPTAKQFIEFAIYNSPNDPDPERPRTLTDGTYFNLSTMPDYYAGQVLTWETGPLAGKSTRILKYRFDPTLGYGILTILAEPTVNDALLEPVQGPINSSRTPELTQLANIQEGANNAGAKFVVNGRPFNGTGVGYNPLAAPGLAKLSAQETVPGVPTSQLTPIALMPNAPFFMPDPGTNIDPTYFSNNWASLTTVQQQNLLRNLGYEGQGGSDESYDAPDFQNMFLAWTGPNVQDTIFTDLNGTAIGTNTYDRNTPPPFLGNIVLPSFHRPDLLNHWVFNPSQLRDLTSPANVHLLRKILLRPNWIDHPDFTGSNPEFAAAAATGNDKLLRMIYGPWDVDNDNDGVRDSVWVDFGAPVMMDQKGRLVKPLAAIMVLDMDGRLNVNAHGTRELAELNGQPPWARFAAGVQSNATPRGQAFGPAEISLGPVLGNKFDNLLVGGSWFTGKIWDGRYGLDDQPGYRDLTQTDRQFDLSAQLKFQGLPSPQLLRRSNYGTFPDLRSRYSVGLNDFGQSITDWIPNDFHDANNNSVRDPGEEIYPDSDLPYELDLSTTASRGRGTAVDNPFSLAEFERVLRAFDVDAGTLSPRLFELLKGNDSNANLNDLNNWRTLITTDSFDLPEPSFQLPEWVRLGPDSAADTAGEPNPDDYAVLMGRQPVNATFADLIEYRIRLANNWVATPLGTPDPNLPAIQRAMRILVAPEMLAGLKLDLNRPFGNGRDDGNGVDDNGNGQIDEPAEYGTDPIMNGVVDEPGEFEIAIDSDGDGLLEEADGDKNSLWAIDYNRAGTNRTLASSAFELSNFRDDIDRNGDGVIDRWERGDYLPDNNSNGIMDSGDGDGTLSQVELVNLHNFRRQLLARHLYVLAMATVDPMPVPAGGPTDANYIQRLKDRARQLAQWAINAVDFRDPDNIMTSFEYSENPFFTGWFVDNTVVPSVLIDGIVNPHYPSKASDPGYNAATSHVQLVWGAERPELLITETLAWHDRATEDLTTEDAVNDEDGDDKYANDQGLTEAGAGGDIVDTDEDQRFRPQGAAFIELYNPWGPSPGANADTHAIDGVGRFSGANAINNNGADLGVDLARTHDNTVNGSPVWRIAAYRSRATEKLSTSPLPVITGAELYSDPDHPEVLYRPLPEDSTPENAMSVREQELLKRMLRCVYFTGQSPTYLNTHIPEGGVPYVNAATNVVMPVRPGRYMVVGSGNEVGGAGSGRYLASFGEPTSPAGVRRGVLLDTNPGAEYAVSVVNGMDINAAGPPPPTTVLTDLAGFPVKSPSELEASNLNLNLPPNPIPGLLSTASVAIIDQSYRPSAGSVAVERRRFTLSEPAKGYPHLVHNSSLSATTNRYVPTVDIPLDDQRGTFARNPGTALPVVNFAKWNDAELVADQMTDREDRLRLPLFNYSLSTGNPGYSTNGNLMRTIPAFSMIYLQRLANPLLPYHRVTNPYITIDSSGANVTVFNGRKADEFRWQTQADVEDGWWKPLPPGFSLPEKAPAFAIKGQVVEYDNSKAVAAFSSVQRGRENNPDPDPRYSVSYDPTFAYGGAEKVQVFMRNRSSSDTTHIKSPTNFVPPVTNNLWNPELIGGRTAPNRIIGVWRNGGGPTGNGQGTGGSFFFKGVPDCTLGFMNEPFRHATTVDPIRDRLKPTDTAGNPSPFPSMAWNNRPFANSGELMNVPAHRSSQLLKQASFITPTNPTPAPPPVPNPNLPRKEVYKDLVYDGVTTPKANQRRSFTEFPYRHLPNFFRAQPGTTPENPGIVGLHRVLDLVSVTSPYVGTETWLNPVAFGNTTVPVANSADPRYGFQPPFNKVPSRREPGRVNINTISNGSVWHGIFHGSAKRNGEDAGHPVVDDDDFASYRRGYGNAAAAPTALDANSPTLFANPFRASSTGDMVPLPAMVRSGLDSTLMRSSELKSPLSATPDPDKDPVFTAEVNKAEYDIKAATDPATNYRYLHRDTDRNPYFRYAPISRLSSMTTNRSNVFAVWVTIGFFEVQEINDGHMDILSRYGGNLANARTNPLFHRVYPEGYLIGKEAGIDTGETVRYREFAIIDRTIPVGFEPGANHNARETIRLQRKIE